MKGKVAIDEVRHRQFKVGIPPHRLGALPAGEYA
jgi:hypothetical protein